MDLGSFIAFLRGDIYISGVLSVRSIKILQSWFLSQEPAMLWRWETMVGVVTGFSTAMISITFIRLMQLLKSQLPRISARRMLTRSVSAGRRTCFLVAYISFMGWLTIEYGKRLGLPEILTLLKEWGRQHSIRQVLILFCPPWSSNLQIQSCCKPARLQVYVSFIPCTDIQLSR